MRRWRLNSLVAGTAVMRDERPECGSRTDNESDKLRLYKRSLMWRLHQITNNNVSLCRQRQDGEENSVAKENC